jgi:enoyl-[acyl-carrier protein] reductase I
MLNGKTGTIFGIANKRSIAWAIARAADRAGADLVITYQNERLQRNLQSLAEELSRPPLLLPCDVTDGKQADALFEAVRRERPHLDFLVHSLAYARKEDLDGEFHDTPLEGWQTALHVSAFSLTALVRRALPLLEGRRGSILTLSYLGGERVIPHYNIMGVAKAALECSVRYLAADLGPAGHRVNAISAGPIKTLAASGVSGFSAMLDIVAARSPMRRNVELEEVGDAALFFLSDLSRAVTGEVLYVDCGYHVMGL